MVSRAYLRKSLSSSGTRNSSRQSIQVVILPQGFLDLRSLLFRLIRSLSKIKYQLMKEIYRSRPMKMKSNHCGKNWIKLNNIKRTISQSSITQCNLLMTRKLSGTMPTPLRKSSYNSLPRQMGFCTILERVLEPCER